MIDADVHCAPASIDALAPYLDDYWRDYVANAGMRLNPTLTGAYPPAAGPPAPADAETLAADLLDPGGLRGAILNCVSSFDVSRNVYYEAALTRAVNDWLKAEWLERDDGCGRRSSCRRSTSTPPSRRSSGSAATSASCRCCCRCATRRRGATSASTRSSRRRPSTTS